MLKSLFSNFIHDKKTVLFAINNTCNCKCKMCLIWKQKNKRVVKFEDAKKALTKLYKNNFGYLQLTGGEPLLNPDFFSIVNYAKRLNFIIFLVTNGTLINQSTAKMISKIAIDNVGVSFHHFNESVFEKISNHKKILSKVISAIKYLKRENVPIEALFTINNYNQDDIEKTVEFINSFDVGVSFCTPMIVKKTSYSLGGSCVEFSDEELKRIILEIIRLKKKGYKIINSKTFLEEVLRFLEGKNKYYCLGGQKIFYLDWNLNFYPCMFKGQPQKIDNVSFDLKKEKCNECFFQCFVEPSLFLISKPLAIKLVLEDIPTYFRFIRR